MSIFRRLDERFHHRGFYRALSLYQAPFAPCGNFIFVHILASPHQRLTVSSDPHHMADTDQNVLSGVSLASSSPVIQ